MVQQQQFGPPGYQQKPYPPRPQFQNIAAQAPPPPQQKNSLESMFEAFMSTQMQTNTDLKNNVNELKARNQMIKSQLTQLGRQVAQLKRPPNHFPSQPEPSSSKGPHQINAITTRSGKVLQDPVPVMRPCEPEVDKGKRKV